MSQSWKDYLANGVPFSGGMPPQRKDVLDMSNEELFLYVEGLRRFQSVPSNDNKSWYAICGIHGLPTVSWPSWNKEIEQETKTGFCTHSSILFLTWHRPYLALFESVLHGHVKDVANSIADSESTKQNYIALADAFRMPYWDWARQGVPIFPDQALGDVFNFKTSSFRAPKIETPLSGPNLSYNPLFKAPIPKNSPVRGVPKLNTDWTVRYPGNDNPQKTMKAALGAYYKKSATKLFPEVEKNLTERVGYILQSYHRYAAMCSNDIVGQDTDSGKEDLKKHAETYGSFEDFHNSVHNLTGGTGHMSHIETSAFDPIFWLHHTNIDRLFAIWQALNDTTSLDAFVTAKPAKYGTFGLSTGSTEAVDTPLYPFRHTTAEKGWHTSATAKRTEPFGYTYPETAGLTYPPSKSQRDGLILEIKKMYPLLADKIRQSQAEVKEAGADLLPQAAILKAIDEQNLKANTTELVKILPTLPSEETLLKKSWAATPRLKSLAQNNKYLEWLVNLKAVKHSLGGSYSVHVFLGPVEDDNVSLWPVSPNHVGSFVPLGQPTTTGCEKCQDDQQNSLEVTGQIPLTLALAERYLAELIEDMSEATVKNYLTTNLHWKVVKGDGSILTNRSDVEGLTVFVVSNEVTVPQSAVDLPVYAQEVTIYPEITTSRDGSGRGDGTGLAQGDYVA